MDKENYEEEERRLRNKIAGINQENCDFLKRQMNEKASRQQAKRMNREEFMLNKPLLKEINQKRKGSQFDGGSQKGSEYNWTIANSKLHSSQTFVLNHYNSNLH